MLRIYSVVIEFLRDLAPVLEGIAQRDRSLAEQARCAASSIALNTAEGSGVRGGNRRTRYFTALGSAREVRACLDVASAWRYVDRLPSPALDRLDHIIATLVKLTR